MEIRQLRETEMEEALQLVWEVFCAFEAPVYSAQGVEEFRSFLQNREEMARQQFFGAWEGGRLIGVLATSGPHISLFFVRREWHRRGVGRALLHAMASAADYPEMTVHSSPLCGGGLPAVWVCAAWGAGGRKTGFAIRRWFAGIGRFDALPAGLPLRGQQPSPFPSAWGRRALHNRMEAAASTGQPFQKNRNGVQAGAYSLGRRLFCAMLSQRFFPSRPLAFAASPFFQRAFLRLPCKKAYLPRIFSEAFSPYSRLENL